MSDELTPEQVAEGLRLDAARTPRQWQVCQGSTHLELRAPHQTERSVARVYCDIDAAFVSHAAKHYGAALRELAGLRKAYDLLLKGMGSQAELMDGLKQSERTARALAARLAEALAPFVPHPDIDCGNDDIYGRAQSALADARAAGLAGEGGQ